MQKIGEKQLAKMKPSMLKVLSISPVDEDNFDTMYVYTSLADQILVFERPMTDLTPSSTLMQKHISAKSDSISKGSSVIKKS